jgi:hypothetical protein
MDETRPVRSQRMPVASPSAELDVIDPTPVSSAVCPCWPASSHSDLNPQTCVATSAAGYTAMLLGRQCREEGETRIAWVPGEVTRRVEVVLRYALLRVARERLWS